MSMMKTLTVNGVTYKVINAVPTDSVTLLASAWKGDGNRYSQVVEVPGVTAHTKVDLQPTAEQLEEFHYKILAFVAENEGGVVTVYSIGDKPTGDHTIQITKTEVEGSGKIRGNTVGTTMPRPDWNQNDPTKADYILNKPECVVTPEMYGAVGNGVADDTAPIQAALNSGYPVVFAKKVYLVSSPLAIGSNGTIVHCYGEIRYTGEEFAVILDSCSNCDVFIKNITAVNGNGLKLYARTSSMCAYNNIAVGEVTAKGTAILTHAEGGNQYNEIRFTKLNADICIDIQCSADGWNTETKWYGGHMGGTSFRNHATCAIKAVNTNGGNVTTHRFYNVGFEGVVDGCILENVKYFVFDNPRTSESIDNKVFILKSGVTGCIFRLSHFKLQWLDFNEHKTGKDGFIGDGNIFSGIFYTDAGAVYKFTYFEIWYGKMYNCNQKFHGYRNIQENANLLTLDPSAYYSSFSQELYIGITNCILDTRYYHAGNINTLYAAMNGDANSSTEIVDSEGKIIARVADYPWKKIKLTAVEQALSSLAPNGWIVEVL